MADSMNIVTTLDLDGNSTKLAFGIRKPWLVNPPNFNLEAIESMPVRDVTFAL